MSNQRAGKTHRAAASDNGLGDMQLLQSLKALREATMGEDEVEWLLDALIEEIRAGRKFPSTAKEWIKVLGL